MNRIIVLGASGQLGQSLKFVTGENATGEFFFLAEEESNILDVNALTKAFATYNPNYCINCAAYTAVDKAEGDLDTARKVNRDGVENIAKLCKEFDTTLIHVSTDFVFDGNSPYPLSEMDTPNPINAYGITKLEGEVVISEYIDNYYILRTSWLYSEFGANFVKTMLKLAKEKSELNIISDQVGTPTYAIDLAQAIVAIINSDNKAAYGIYHYSNEGVASWYDFAKAIFDIAGIAISVFPIRTSQYPTPAKRPVFSVMDKGKIKDTFKLDIPYWRYSLQGCIAKLLA
ncbi:dTDP-4-dehydrorhamnose reductase [Mucilaginibacter paludis]|uniref:dTDP-4-dehydrorhamnose reductase n=1 Tax=Mucilaginibacter paludis DSM 18603 TaxID=714943 RepID=H1Y6I2_9SPHI|nr:dTDP-4-dehydrorhamnose reductase [Mucilaginibacter paludis]EHQ25826.1 dTDP-4-dehydrorhamnose reductase [Mucilaginibacter paludis DSM 18603]